MAHLEGGHFEAYGGVEKAGEHVWDEADLSDRKTGGTVSEGHGSARGEGRFGEHVWDEADLAAVEPLEDDLEGVRRYTRQLEDGGASLAGRHARRQRWAVRDASDGRRGGGRHAVYNRRRMESDGWPAVDGVRAAGAAVDGSTPHVKRWGALDE